jgi:hypothetical protein
MRWDALATRVSVKAEAKNNRGLLFPVCGCASRAG